MKKVLGRIMTVVFILTISIVPLSATVVNPNGEIIQHMVEVNQRLGVELSQTEINNLETTIDIAVDKYCKIYSISAEDAYEMILDEVLQETPITFEVTAYATMNVSLPTASEGAIFYIDSDTAWNHVGLYTSRTTIVEAMPEDGVQYWRYDDIGARQNVVTNPLDGINDSCILSVNTTNANRTAAAAWPRNNVPAGTPYDYDFLDNKSDYYFSGNGDYIYSENDAFNCSELVWKAYMKAANIDLDSNGGLAVYPNNILHSSQVTAVRGNWW